MCFNYLLLTEAGVSENLALQHSVGHCEFETNSVYKKVRHSGPWFVLISSCGFSFRNFH